MSLIGIIANQKQINQIRKEIEQDIKELKIEIIPINSNSIENIKNIKFDVIIVLETFEKLKNKENYVKNILNNSKYLLLNEDNKIKNEILKDINVRIITFGLNQKSTITVSSIGDNKIIICIQRSFENIQRSIVEPKEIKRELTKNNIRNIYNSLIKEAIINVYGTEKPNKSW